MVRAARVAHLVVRQGDLLAALDVLSSSGGVRFLALCAALEAGAPAVLQPDAEKAALAKSPIAHSLLPRGGLAEEPYEAKSPTFYAQPTWDDHGRFRPSKKRLEQPRESAVSRCSAHVGMFVASLRARVLQACDRVPVGATCCA